MSRALRQVRSAEWVALARPVVRPTEDGARELGRRYWAELRRLSHGLVRVRGDEEGPVELVLVPALTLFRFGSPDLSADSEGVECRFPIVGGLLVGRPGGSLAIVQRTAPVLELGLVVTGYHPRLTSGSMRSVSGALYAHVQERLHLAVSRRFLERAAGGHP